MLVFFILLLLGDLLEISPFYKEKNLVKSALSIELIQCENLTKNVMKHVLIKAKINLYPY